MISRVTKNYKIRHAVFVFKCEVSKLADICLDPTTYILFQGKVATNKAFSRSTEIVGLGLGTRVNSVSVII